MAGNISHGMNIDEVNQLGNHLKSTSGEITKMITAINTKVNNTSWVGPDASKFKNDWWPQHRGQLQKMVQDLDGFGQSALNNATDQARISNG